MLSYSSLAILFNFHSTISNRKSKLAPCLFTNTSCAKAHARSVAGGSRCAGRCRPNRLRIVRPAKSRCAKSFPASTPRPSSSRCPFRTPKGPGLPCSKKSAKANTNGSKSILTHAPICGRVKIEWIGAPLVQDGHCFWSWRSWPGGHRFRRNRRRRMPGNP